MSELKIKTENDLNIYSLSTHLKIGVKDKIGIVTMITRNGKRSIIKFIDKSDAIQIINYLKKQFNL